MGESYSFEIVEKAEELYCVDGQSFDAVATLTGVAASTVKRWSERYNWQEKKEKIRQALSSIRTNTILLRARLIENCMTTLAANDAFAVASLESMAQKAAAAAAKNQLTPKAPETLREIKTDEDAVAALEEAVQIRLNSMLSNPGQISLAAVKDMKQALALVRDLKTRADAAEGDKRAKVIDASELKELREQLGL